MVVYWFRVCLFSTLMLFLLIFVLSKEARLGLCAKLLECEEVSLIRELDDSLRSNIF